MDLSEKGVGQEPKIGEGVKGSTLQSLDLSEEGVSQEPKRKEGSEGIHYPKSGSVRAGREPWAKENEKVKTSRLQSLDVKG